MYACWVGTDEVYPEEGGAMIKICLIINNINQYGGIERVYAQLATIFSKHLQYIYYPYIRKKGIRFLSCLPLLMLLTLI